MSQPATYSRRHIILHWVIAFLVLGQFLMADGIRTAFENRTSPEAVAPAGLGAAYIHMFIGTLILALMLWRLSIRLKGPIPSAPEGQPRALTLVASTTHWAFYGLLIAMPVFGHLAWWGGNENLGDGHGTAATILFWLALLHVLAALYHLLFDKGDRVFYRMAPQGGVKRD